MGWGTADGLRRLICPLSFQGLKPLAIISVVPSGLTPVSVKDRLQHRQRFHRPHVLRMPVQELEVPFQ